MIIFFIIITTLNLFELLIKIIYAINVVCNKNYHFACLILDCHELDFVRSSRENAFLKFCLT